MLSVFIPLIVGFALNEWSHRRRGRAEHAATLDAEHRHRQIEVLGELREVVLEYGEVTSAHLWAGWSEVDQVGIGNLRGEVGEAGIGDLSSELESLHDCQERLALRLFSLCASVDDPWIRHRVDYLEERGRWAVVEPGTQYLQGGHTSSSVEALLSDDRDIQRRVVLINNLIGERLLALTGGRRLPEWPENVGAEAGGHRLKVGSFVLVRGGTGTRGIDSVGRMS